MALGRHPVSLWRKSATTQGGTQLEGHEEEKGRRRELGKKPMSATALLYDLGQV